MTTSPQPWHLELKPDGFTYIKDAVGKQVAQFLEFNDAEFLLKTAPQVWQELKDEIQGLNYDINDYEFKIGNHKNTIEKLETQIKTLLKQIEELKKNK